MGNGIRLFLMVFLGFVLIEIGLSGKLGSILGAFLVPQYMQAGPVGQTLGTEHIFQNQGGA